MKTQLTTIKLSLVVIGALIMAACGQEDTDQGATPGPSQQSACKPQSKGALGSGVNAAVSGRDVTVTHVDARYNCASKVQLVASVTGDKIRIDETITNPELMARCSCEYDLSLTIKNLAPGTYSIDVHDADGKPAGSASVVVAGPVKVLVGGTLQSACKPQPRGFAAAAVTAAVKGGTVTVTHTDANYNCAAKVKLTAKVTGNKIRIDEVITNPGELALCMCDVDLSVTLGGLKDGTYQIDVYDADGKLVGAASITAGSPLPVAGVLQSACKAETDGPATGKIKATASGGAIRVEHLNAEYNCFATLAMAATLSGATITVREKVTNPGVTADCTCKFDLAVMVQSLLPGPYKVEVLDAAGKLVGSAAVKI